MAKLPTAFAMQWQCLAGVEVEDIENLRPLRFAGGSYRIPCSDDTPRSNTSSLGTWLEASGQPSLDGLERAPIITTECMTRSFCSCGPTVVYRRTTAQGMYRTQMITSKTMSKKMNQKEIIPSSARNVAQLGGELRPINRTVNGPEQITSNTLGEVLVSQRDAYSFLLCIITQPLRRLRSLGLQESLQIELRVLGIGDDCRRGLSVLHYADGPNLMGHNWRGRKKERMVTYGHWLVSWSPGAWFASSTPP